MKGWHWAALALLSGLLPAYVLHGVGWSLTALPPLLLVVGLIQLSYCDITRRLLPKTMVYGLTAVVVASGISVAADLHMWERLKIASIGGFVFFAVFLVINLINPRWMAFGDVRLSLVVGFGFAWISPVALLEGFALPTCSQPWSASRSSSRTGPRGDRACPSASFWLSVPRSCWRPGPSRPTKRLDTISVPQCHGPS